MKKTLSIIFCAQPRDIYGSFSWKKPIQQMIHHYSNLDNTLEVRVEYHLWDKISDKPGALEPVQKLLPVTLSEQVEISSQILDFWGEDTTIKFYDYDLYMNKMLSHIEGITKISKHDLFAADLDRWLAQHKSRNIALNNSVKSDFVILTRTDIEVNPNELFYKCMYDHMKLNFEQKWISGKPDSEMIRRIETFGLEVYGSWNVFHQDFWTASSYSTLHSLYTDFIDKMLMHWTPDDFLYKKDEVYFALKNSHNMFQQWIIKHTKENISLVSNCPTSSLRHIMTREKDK